MTERAVTMRGPMEDHAVQPVSEEIVVAEVTELEPARPAQLPVAQAAAVAATGFVAGAATLAVVRRRSARRALKRRSNKDRLPIVGSRSFLVDVHLIGRD
jgi:hypothetical protein